MKILCLHGAYGSAQAFRVQLDPFIGQLQTAADIELVFVDGEFPATPPAGFETYFGPPPWFRNINHDGVGSIGSIVDFVRDHVEAESYDDSLRDLFEKDESINDARNLVKTFHRIRHLIEQDDEIEGILGYSEGATAAASYLVHERKLEREQGRPRRLRYAIFFSGWPPCKIEGGDDDGSAAAVRTILSDECTDLIEVPTCHIVGSLDPYLYGAMGLYGVCSEDNATLFEHGKGHTVPRDNATISELATAIKMTIAAA